MTAVRFSPAQIANMPLEQQQRLAKLIILSEEVRLLDQRIAGLGMTPKGLREERRSEMETVRKLKIDEFNQVAEAFSQGTSSPNAA